ncbi:MAG: hypothetical protein EOP38_00410 [Rubrivivax sp.]|nr:MAG: hypothetical protein EOP38_00410 [Rubrivivax sp.]
MKALFSQWLQALDRLSERDRMALLAALIAAAIGWDMLVVMPMKTQRLGLIEGMTASAQGAQQAVADVEKQRQAEMAALTQRQVQVQKDLAAFGLNNALKDSLSFMLARTLRNQAVTIQSLKALAVDELNIEAATNPAEAVDSATAVAANRHPPLYRHRYELVLQGELKNMGPTLNALERDSRPLRLESVHLRTLPTGAIELTAMLVTIGLEKTWLAL